MCGINGITTSDAHLMQSLNGLIKYRGPDGDGVYSDADVSLGHVRLAIIDPSSTADQPMKSADGSVVLTFNGEIYNYKELRQELTAEYSFVTQSDTEVIIAGYIVWGEAIFDRLNGIFALGLWDGRKKLLYLARDQRGVKPLYYWKRGKDLLFSSELKSLIAAGAPTVLDPIAFQYYMRLRYVPNPLTMLHGTEQLSAGKLLCYHHGDVTIRSLQYEAKSLAGMSVRSVIADAVARQVVADKPVGIFLSGGTDSTIVAYEAVKHVPHMEAFSTWFAMRDQQLSERFNADALVAADTAKTFGLQHQMVEIRSEDLASHLEQMVWHCDLPVPSVTMLSQYLIAEAAKGKVDVALGGDGGDEYFGGYHRYRYAYFMEHYQYLPTIVRRQLARLHPLLRKINIADRAAVIEQFALEKTPELKTSLTEYQPDAIQSWLSSLPLLATPRFSELLMEFDRQYWLPDFSLIRSDKLSMAHGLELRVPLLDLEVAAIAATISTDRKLSWGSTKKMLRSEYADVLPRAVTERPKTGWISPGAKWLREPVVETFFKQVLTQDYYRPTASLFDWSTVEQYWQEHKTGTKYHYNVLLSIAVFQIWARQFKVTL